MSVEETLNKKCLKCDVNGHNWVSEEEFRVVFPRGYRDCNFFSRPYEYWSMTEGKYTFASKDNFTSIHVYDYMIFLIEVTIY